MKRWPRRISPRRAAFGGTLCLILGVVTTVGVAWIFAACAPFWPFDTGGEASPMVYDGEQTSWDAEDEEWWITNCPFDVSAGPYLHVDPESPPPAGVDNWPLSDQIIRARVVGLDIRYVEANIIGSQTIEQVVAIQFKSGYPANALEATRWTFKTDLPRTVGSVIVDGIEVAPAAITYRGDMLDFRFGPRLLPLRPVFPGFLINTLFYAAIWFGLFFAPGMARRFIRTRRGRCPRCGYDLRGEFKGGCSECGWGRGDCPPKTQKRRNVETQKRLNTVMGGARHARAGRPADEVTPRKTPDR